MDGKTTEIRYQQWIQVIQDWSNSGLSKRDYCRQNGIDEKKIVEAYLAQAAAGKGRKRKA